jgi:hypothetical protein
MLSVVHKWPHQGVLPCVVCTLLVFVASIALANAWSPADLERCINSAYKDPLAGMATLKSHADDGEIARCEHARRMVGHRARSQH